MKSVQKAMLIFEISVDRANGQTNMKRKSMVNSFLDRFWVGTRKPDVWVSDTSQVTYFRPQVEKCLAKPFKRVLHTTFKER